MALPLFNAVPTLSPAFLPSEETNIRLSRIDLGKQTGNEQGKWGDFDFCHSGTDTTIVTNAIYIKYLHCLFFCLKRIFFPLSVSRCRQSIQVNKDWTPRNRWETDAWVFIIGESIQSHALIHCTACALPRRICNNIEKVWLNGTLTVIEFNEQFSSRLATVDLEVNRIVIWLPNSYRLH